MAMTKKEQAEVERLKDELRRARAFKFTPEVKPDVMPPDSISELSTGFMINTYRASYGGYDPVDVGCSSYVHHARGRTDKTDSQGSVSLFSTRLFALKAARHELENDYSKWLAEIDEMIEKEEANGK